MASLPYVPFRRPNLVGREAAVEELHRALGFGHAAVLTPTLAGQGGVGKTQLAVLYAHDKAANYPGGIFWINANEPKTITRQLANYATSLGLKTDVAFAEEADRQRALRFVGEVGQNKDALLILDNVEDPSVVTEDLPDLPNIRVLSLGCLVIITSRRSLPSCRNVPVDLLKASEDRELLLRESERSPTGVDDDKALVTQTLQVDR